MTAHKPKKLITVCVDDIVAQQIPWLWKPFLARSSLSIVAGHPGLGKSQIMAFLAATVSRGMPWPCEYGPRKPGSVLILSAEESPCFVVRPKLEAANADLKRIYLVQGVEGDFGDQLFRLEKDIASLKQKAEELGGVDLIIIDPITSYMSGIDPNNMIAVRSLMAPLQKLAEETGAAIVVVTHLNKSGFQSAMAKVSGSGAFVAASRSTLLVVREPKSDRIFFVSAKNNLGKSSAALAYRINEVKTSAGDMTPYIEWDAELIFQTADELVAAEGGAFKTSAKADDFLADFLSDGSKLATEVFAKAEASGFSEKNVRDAKKRLGVISERIGGAACKGNWRWELPSKAAKATKIPSQENGHLSNLSELGDLSLEDVLAN